MDYKKLIETNKDLFINKLSPYTIIFREEDNNWRQKQKSLLPDQSNSIGYGDIGVVYDDAYIVLIRDLVEFPGGKRGGYIRLYNRAFLEGGAAGVVIMPVKDGKILLMHNFRHATRSWHWEIPRGFGEPGVAAKLQAKAEVFEEIGVRIDEDDLFNLGNYYSNTGLDGSPIQLFLAKFITEPIIHKEIGVDSIKLFSQQELEKMIKDDLITDGFTIAAYTRAKLKGLI